MILDLNTKLGIGPHIKPTHTAHEASVWCLVLLKPTHTATTGGIYCIIITGCTFTKAI